MDHQKSHVRDAWWHIGAMCLCSMLLTGSIAGAVDSDDEAQFPGSAEGFRTLAELQPIVQAMKQENYAEAQSAASAVVSQSADSFGSPKQERFVKATAYRLRGEAGARLGDDASALRDFEQAAQMGDATSAYHMGARMTIQLTSATDVDRREQLKQRAESYYRMGAELGQRSCLDLLQTICELQGNVLEQHYWFLLERMAELREFPERFVDFYSEEYDESDRDLLARAMQQHSLCGGESEPVSEEIPGRSTLTAALTDYWMRRQLDFVWRAFWSDAEPDNTPLLETYRAYRAAVSHASFADVYLLVPTPSDSADEPIVTVSREKLAENLLPGDGIIVRCGRLVHYATVWSINKSDDRILLLDPFHGYWQPTHNRCISNLSVEPFKHERRLVKVPWSDVQGMLVAVFALRDKASED